MRAPWQFSEDLLTKSRPNSELLSLFDTSMLSRNNTSSHSKTKTFLQNTQCPTAEKTPFCKVTQCSRRTEILNGELYTPGCTNVDTRWWCELANSSNDLFNSCCCVCCLATSLPWTAAFNCCLQQIKHAVNCCSFSHQHLHVQSDSYYDTLNNDTPNYYIIDNNDSRSNC